MKVARHISTGILFQSLGAQSFNSRPRDCNRGKQRVTVICSGNGESINNFSKSDGDKNNYPGFETINTGMGSCKLPVRNPKFMTAWTVHVDRRVNKSIHADTQWSKKELHVHPLSGPFLVHIRSLCLMEGARSNRIRSNTSLISNECFIRFFFIDLEGVIRHPTFEVNQTAFLRISKCL